MQQDEPEPEQSGVIHELKIELAGNLTLNGSQNFIMTVH